MTWNGSRWSAPALIDPHGSGLTSVSCTAAGCLTADWDGDAFVWHAGHWHPAGQLDANGSGLESVSCNPDLCAAANWNGGVTQLLAHK